MINDKLGFELNFLSYIQNRLKGLHTYSLGLDRVISTQLNFTRNDGTMYVLTREIL
jgi:hypothetical protein